MATTRLIALHTNKGKTPAQSITERLEYCMNPDKTNGGVLVSSYGCAPQTAAMEFAHNRRAYLQRTGRYQQGEVIGYHLRQSFKPGEITPEEANRVGYELAQRFFKGKHAFVVATHVDREHIHSHIIVDSVALDSNYKFKNFLGSGKALGRLSDQICLEHQLSVIENPQHKDSGYDRWLGEKAKLTNRDLLRIAIDEALQKQPDGFEALMQLLEEAGWRMKRGKQISFLPPNGKRFIRMDTLGEEYSEQTLREVLSGTREHEPKRTRRMKKQKVSLIVDIQKKLAEGKGKGYENWAKVFNVKQLAASMAYLSEQGIDSYEELTAKLEAATAKNDELLKRMETAEDRLQEITALKKSIHAYLRTKEVYAEWKNTGWSKSFYAAYEKELAEHKAAKEEFNKISGRIPTIKELTAEYEKVLSEKQRDFAEYRDNRSAMRELLTVKANVDIVTGRQAPQKGKKENQHAL